LQARASDVYVPNDYVAGYVAQHPEELIGFASVDPSEPGCVEALERAIKRLGLRGLKLGPVYQHVDPNGARVARVLRAAERLGITGIADMESQPHVIKAIVEAPRHGGDLFSGLKHLVVGEDPFEVERLWQRMFERIYYYGRRGAVLQAISGIDIACWDIMGKATGLPIYKLLGAGYRDRVRAYASTLFRPTPEAMAEACRLYLAQGFTAIKFGWGVFGQDPALDVRLMEAARRTVGEDVALLVDAGWFVHRTPKESIAMIERLGALQPLLGRGAVPPRRLPRLRRRRGRCAHTYRRRRAGSNRVGLPSAYRRG
jgi:L-alanine-DL-glutamate epimerase-like enolase superfamily enzyme